MTTSVTARPGELSALPAAWAATPLEDLPLAPDGHHVMHLLERGVPLTLLIDLLTPYAPDSSEILATEARAGS